MGNGGDGVHIDTSASSNTVGGTAAGAGNTISFNISDGVNLVSTAGTGNAIRGNSIDSNGSLGIDLGLNGVTENDLGSPPDQDSGANNLQNFPDLTYAVKQGGVTRVGVVLNSTPNTGSLWSCLSALLVMQVATVRARAWLIMPHPPPVVVAHSP